jgi:hypothetical protein
MMRPLMRTLALLGACLAAGGAGGALAAGSQDRSWPVTVSPSPGDVSLVQIAFPHARSARVSGATLEVRPPAAFGSDYLAVAVVRRPLGSGALVLVANRPSPLDDPARPVLAVRARRALGSAVVGVLQNLFARPASAPPPRLCDLALHGTALTAGGLTVLGGAGVRLTGLGAADAVAQAYDIACGLPNPGNLRQSLSLPAAGGCTPCDPAPGYACPLGEASAALCAAPVGAGRRAAAAATH